MFLSTKIEIEELSSCVLTRNTCIFNISNEAQIQEIVRSIQRVKHRSQVKNFTSNCLIVSSKFDRSTQRTVSCSCNSENSASMICSHSFTRFSLLPSSTKRFLSLSVDTDMWFGARERWSLSGWSGYKPRVDTKACIHATRSFLESVLRWRVLVAVNI